MEHKDFEKEAAAWMSSAFTKKETLEKLIEQACPPLLAEAHVNRLIRKSQIKGWSELFTGLMVGLIGYFAGVIYGELGVFVFDIILTIAKIGGVILFLDGIRRLGSLAFVTRTSIIPSVKKN